MDGEVEAHELDEVGVVVAQHGGEVVAPILVGVDGANTLAIAEHVAVDGSGHDWQLGNQIHRVLVDVLKLHKIKGKFYL